MNFNYKDISNGLGDDLKLSDSTVTNFTKIFTLIRPDIINKGDRLQVIHRNQEYIIPLTRYQRQNNGYIR